MKPLQEALDTRRLYWTSFALRLALGMVAVLGTYVYEVPLLEDATAYSERAAQVAQSWLNGEQSDWLIAAIEEGREAWLMPTTLAVFYCLTGGVETLPLAIACYCLLTSLTPVLAYRAARELGVPPRGTAAVGWLVAWSPAFVFWSGALYKEGLILIALFLIVEHALRLQKAFRLQSFLVLAACLVAMFGLRFYMGAILTVCILAALVLGRRSPDSEDGAPAVFRQVLVLLVLVTVFSLIGLQERVQTLLSVKLEDNLQQIETSRRDLALSRSGYLQDARISDVDGALQFLPIGMTYFLLVPFPWDFGALRQNLVIPETLFWVVIIYPLALRGIWRAARANPQGTLFLLLCALSMCCLYAIVIGNIGTAYRERIQLWAILALFAGWGWARAEEPPSGARASRGDRRSLDYLGYGRRSAAPDGSLKRARQPWPE